MRILATVVLRTSKPQEAHGFLVAIDWATRRVVRTIAAPALYSELGYRNRGGRRGFRGLARHRGKVWLAASDAIYLLDPAEMAIVGMVSHRYMGSIHDLFGEDDGVWVTCTGADGIFKIGEGQDVIDERWAKGPPTHDLRIHFDDALDTLHVNSIYRYRGELYFYAAFTGEVYRVTAAGLEVTDTLEAMCHNVFRDERGFFRSVSPLSELRYGDRTIALPRGGPSGEFTHPGWLRGLERLPNGHVLVGSSPARIFEVDLQAARVVDQLVLKEDSNWTISGIAVLEETRAAEQEARALDEIPADLLETRLESFDPYPELSRLAYAKFNAGAYADALELVRICLQLEDRYPQDALDALRFHEGLCHFFLGDYARSLSVLDLLEKYAVGRRPHLGPLKYYQGLCHERLGDRQRALESFRQAPRYELEPALRAEVERSLRRLELAAAE